MYSMVSYIECTRDQTGYWWFHLLKPPLLISTIERCTLKTGG